MATTEPTNRQPTLADDFAVVRRCLAYSFVEPRRRKALIALNRIAERQHDLSEERVIDGHDCHDADCAALRRACKGER